MVAALPAELPLPVRLSCDAILLLVEPTPLSGSEPAGRMIRPVVPVVIICEWIDHPLTTIGADDLDHYAAPLFCWRDPQVECALFGGQRHAAVLTRRWAC